MSDDKTARIRELDDSLGFVGAHDLIVTTSGLDAFPQRGHVWSIQECKVYILGRH